MFKCYLIVLTITTHTTQTRSNSADLNEYTKIYKSHEYTWISHHICWAWTAVASVDIWCSSGHYGKNLGWWWTSADRHPQGFGLATVFRLGGILLPNSSSSAGKVKTYVISAVSIMLLCKTPSRPAILYSNKMPEHWILWTLDIDPNVRLSIGISRRWAYYFLENFSSLFYFISSVSMCLSEELTDTIYTDKKFVFRARLKPRTFITT